MIKRLMTVLMLLTLAVALGAGGFAEKRSKHLDLSEKINRQKTVYLTFDDGPSVENTDAILDVLEEEGVKATFFITGPGKEHLISKTDWSRLITRMDADGHVIGNHTYDHRYELVYKSADAFMKSVDKLDEAVYRVTGKHTTLFRFPGGSTNPYIKSHTGTNRYAERVLAVLLKQSGYKYFDWNVSSADAAVATNRTDVIISYVKKGVSENKRCIVLHHDSSSKTTTVEALKAEIRWMKELGCSFDTLDHADGSYLFRTEWGTK